MVKAKPLGPQVPAITTNGGFAGSVLLGVLGFCALALTCFPLLHLRTYAALNYNEGWNAYREHMAVQHLPLYASPPVFGITNYPFLSFHIIGAFSRLFGSVNIAGRIVDLTALLIITALIAATVREIQPSWRIGVYAGLCFYVWVCTFTPENLGINDPQMLGSAFSMLGVYAYVRGRQRNSWLVLSAVSFALSVYTKDNLIAFPVAIALKICFERQWRALLIWAIVGIATAATLLVLTIWLDGHYFLSHLLRSRSARYGRGLDNIEEFLGYFYVPMSVAILWIARWERSSKRTFVLLMFGTASLFTLLFVFGNGVGKNVFYDMMIATALAVGVAVPSFSSTLPQSRMAGVIATFLFALPALPGIALTPLTFSTQLASWHKVPRLATEAAQGVAVLKVTSGPVLCENLLLCFDADKPMVFDAYFVHDQIRTHRIRESAILSQIETQHYNAIEIDTAPDEPITTRERNRFSAAFMGALLRSYQPILQTSSFTIFRPR